MDEFKKLSSLDSDERVDKYKKNDDVESFLNILNDSLANVDDYIQNSLNNKSYPSILIVGMPRTGSTLLNQVLASRLNISYVSNLMARFYHAPLTGAYLQNILLKNSITNLRDYRSTHGNTNLISEPNEFGYFWSSYLNFGKEIHEPENNDDSKIVKIKELEKTLENISSVFKQPVLYKCSIAPFFLKELSAINSLFIIHLTRNKEDVIKSVLKVRKERLNDINKWWSIRPAKYKEWLKLSPEEQVSKQYDSVENAINKSLGFFKNRVISVSYEEFVDNPEVIIDNLVLKLQSVFNYNFSKIGSDVCL